MKIVLPEKLWADVKISFDTQQTLYSLTLFKDERLLNSYQINGNLFPELKYLITLYYYDEDIPVSGVAPHAISLEEYKLIYEALFGIECTYTDKHRSIDHIRSYELQNRVLKPNGLRFARVSAGGLCCFTSGSPDPEIREQFRNELLNAFRSWCESHPADRDMRRRYRVLKSFRRQNPAAYMGIDELIEQDLRIEDKKFQLYAPYPGIDFVHILEEYPHVLLCGDCGSGKSTLLKFLTFEPHVHESYTVIFRHLIQYNHLFAQGEADRLEDNPDKKYLFLLDGLSELPHSSGLRSRILSEIIRLSRYDNARIILSTTGTIEMLDGFVNASMGHIHIGNMQASDDIYLIETPLIYNAYISIPKAERKSLNNTYAILDYAYRIRLEALLEKYGGNQVELMILAYQVLLPMLAERMCLNGSILFSEQDKLYLFDALRKRDTEQSIMLKYIFRRLDADCPDVSAFSYEMLENVFNRLIAHGDVLPAKKQYMLRHQRIRDLLAVKYQLEKLKLILSNMPDDNVCPYFNLGSSASELFRMAVGFDKTHRLFCNEFVRNIISRIEPMTSAADFNPRSIKLVYTIAAINEYLYPRFYMTYEQNDPFEKTLRLGTDWVKPDREAAKEAIKNSGEPQLSNMLEFIFCRQVECSQDYVNIAVDPVIPIENAMSIARIGLELFENCVRLSHSAAKSLLYLSELTWQQSDKEKSAVLFDIGLMELEDCFHRGSFLSGNLLAFIHRTPVPFIMQLRPNIVDHVFAFTINLSVAMDPMFGGTKPGYARNEALDALFMGEVSINSPISLKVLTSIVKKRSSRSSSRVIIEGNGICGKNELQLAKELLSSRGGILGDRRPLTAFYSFICDFYSLGYESKTVAGIRKLRDAHMSTLKLRIDTDAYSRMILLLVLNWLNSGIAGDEDYAPELITSISELSKKLNEMCELETDAYPLDLDHPYYYARRFLFYYQLLFQSTGTTPFRPEMYSLSESVLRFKNRYKIR